MLGHGVLAPLRAVSVKLGRRAEARAMLLAGGFWKQVSQLAFHCSSPPPPMPTHPLTSSALRKAVVDVTALWAVWVAGWLLVLKAWVVWYNGQSSLTFLKAQAMAGNQITNPTPTRPNHARQGPPLPCTQS